MTWQDILISGSQVGFLLTLIPLLQDRTVLVPHRTSVPTALCLTANAVAFSTLDGLTWSAGLSFLGAIGWAFIAGTRTRLVKDGIVRHASRAASLDQSQEQPGSPRQRSEGWQDRSAAPRPVRVDRRTDDRPEGPPSPGRT